MPKIKNINAYEILDSRGDPTLKTQVVLENGAFGSFSVPSGASKGKAEALELRDDDSKRYRGKGVLKACANVNEVIAKGFIGQSFNQKELDNALIALDGTSNKTKLGANAILSVSIAFAKACARSENEKLYIYLREIYDKSLGDEWIMPMPMFNVFNGGEHADTNQDIQEFMIIPASAKKFSEALRIGSETFHSLQDILKEKGFDTDVGNEGGFAPDVEYLTQPFDFIKEGAEKAGYGFGSDIKIGIDAGASVFYKDKKYDLRLGGFDVSSSELLSIFEGWVSEFQIVSIEDGMAEEDWQGWQEMNGRLGGKIQLIGDDLLATNVKRLEKAIELKACNAVLVKVNQIGTLSETFDVLRLAKKNNFGTIISHRSGETTDTFIADLAVGVNAGQIKFGSLTRGERVCKYNRLLEIEKQLKNSKLFHHEK